MNDNINIRPMEVFDVDAVLRIENTLLGLVWTRQSFLESLDNENSHIYLACDVQDPKNIYGYIVLYRALDEAEIVNVAVDEKLRRRGIGKALLDTVLKKEHDKGINIFILEVRSKNIPAQKLYENAGFLSCGKRKKFYEKPADDAIVMRLEV